MNGGKQMIEQCPICGKMMENGQCEACAKNKTKHKQHQSNTQFQHNYHQSSGNQSHQNPGSNGNPQNGYQHGNNHTNYYNNFQNHFGYQSPKNRIVALLLCVFLGYWGIHYFYTGKIGMGIIYLITGGLCGIGWIVDIIRIASGTFSDKFGRLLS